MFNPSPAVSLRPIGEDATCVVLDDVLTEPGALVALAARHRGGFVMASGNAFPGLELPLPDGVAQGFGEVFSRHARRALGARRVLRASGRLSLVTLPPERLSAMQRVCHRDRLAERDDECVGAAVLYLFHDAALGGTAFFRSRHDAAHTEALMRRWSGLDAAAFGRETGWPPAYMTASNQHFERVASVEPRFNRMICYDGGRFHCSDIAHPERLSDEPGRGRLTVNLFFVCRRSAR